MRPVTRIKPMLPVQEMKTYQVTAPVTSHFRIVGCEQTDCGAFNRGWKTQIDETTELGQQQAHYIRKMSGRRFRVENNVEGLTDFIFEPGQPCFKEHRVRLGKEANYLVRHGDHRGFLGAATRHTRPEDWVDDFRTHQDRISTIIERG